MTNDEARMTNYRRLSPSRPALPFVIRNSSFFRHSSLGIRHLRAAISVKERARNNLPISCWLGLGRVVPFGQNVVENDLHGLFEARHVLAAYLICFVEDANDNFQARGR